MAGFANGKLILDSEPFVTTGSDNDVPCNSSLMYIIVSNDLDEITGIDPSTNDGFLILVVNVGPTNTLILKNDSASSIAENRIISADGEDCIVEPLETALLGYDTAGQRWHCIKVAPAEPRNYISLHDTTTQNIATPGTFQTVTFDTTDLINGWTHTPGTDAMTCPRTGTYHTDGFVHMVKTGGPSSLFEFRVTVNGTPVGQVSATTLNTNNEVKSLARTRVVQLTKGDVVRVEWTAGVNSALVPPATVGTPLSIAFGLYQIT